jgi:hypothetical protein
MLREGVVNYEIGPNFLPGPKTPGRPSRASEAPDRYAPPASENGTTETIAKTLVFKMAQVMAGIWP